MNSNGTLQASPANLASAFIRRVTAAPRRLPNRVILHATEGWGKTSFAAFAPNPIFLMSRSETGLWTLMNAGCLPENIAHFPTPVETHRQTLDAIDQLAREDHPFRTLVIDTLNGVEKLIHEQVCRENFNDDWTESGFTGYQRGQRVAVPYFVSLLSRLDTLRDKGMSIILLCHTQVSTFKNPEGADYDRYTPALAKETWAEAGKWADIILFGSRQTTVTTQSKKAIKGKAHGTMPRIMNTERTPAFDAKNRHSLPATIPCGQNAQDAWQNFLAAMKRPTDRP